jgi:hypothetical protein
VGNNGETLVADSSTSTGLRYQANFAAGKNKVINGDFGIWQRGTSFTASNAYFYGADRWNSYSYGASATTISQQTFTPGTAPVAGYEGQYFLRITSTTSQIYLEQKVEDVRTFAGQTVTFSFWAKQATGAATALGTTLVQYFGSGGSGNVNTTIISSQTTTTGWTRYTGTATLPSISGKTLGAGNYLAIQIANGSLNNALDIWGVQLEAGSVATAFQTATGTIQGELAACQRYYYRTGGSLFTYFAAGSALSTTAASVLFNLPVQMRIKPTSVDFGNVRLSDLVSGFTISALTIANDGSSANVALLDATGASGLTQFRPLYLTANNNTAGFVGVSAEL